MAQVIFFILVFLVVPTILIYRTVRDRNRRKAMVDDIPVQDEMVPVKAGKHTIYLRNSEVKNYLEQPRITRKTLIAKYERLIKKGILVPVKENGEIKGYITKKDATKHGQNNDEQCQYSQDHSRR